MSSSTPGAAKALSERIGTALINGSWFIRGLKSLAGRAVLMHGHRHVDWVGECAGLTIVSAPSPVMNATDDARRISMYTHWRLGWIGVCDCCSRNVLPSRVSRVLRK